MPAKPRKCIGKNVRFKLTIDSQKCTWPWRSGYITPVHFGAQ
jgi:hypothetical protein